MKEKRYFCDWFSDNFRSKRIKIIFPISLIIVVLISYCISYNIYKDEVTAYSENDYTYLKESLEDIYDKNSKSINISSIPKNVEISNITLSSEETKFTCKMNKGFFFISNPAVNVKIIQNGEIISITHKDKNEATNPIILFIFPITIVITCSPISVLIIMLILTVAESISIDRKRYDKRKV